MNPAGFSPCALYQGTTSVVPNRCQEEPGFSPCDLREQ